VREQSFGKNAFAGESGKGEIAFFDLLKKGFLNSLKFLNLSFLFYRSYNIQSQKKNRRKDGSFNRTSFGKV